MAAPRSRPRAPFQPEMFASWFKARRDGLVSRLLELIAIRTESPDEEACFPWLQGQIEALGGTSRVEQPPAGLEQHPAFTHSPFVNDAPLRPNLRARFPAEAAMPQLLLNAHVDVVPAVDFPRAYAPILEDGEILGRGAVDTKNNIVMVLGAIEFLRDANLSPAYGLHADFVVEEEFGGNGTLASILNGCPADEVIVLEPTGLEIFRGHRGCLSFEIHVETDGAHMGSGAGSSAIDAAVTVIDGLRRLERRLTRQARLDPDFRRCKRPTPVSIGFVQGGEWHGSVPSRCEIRGNIGFLPSDRLSSVRSTIEQAVADAASAARSRCRVTYSGIHNGAYVIPEKTPLVEHLRSSRRRQLRRDGRLVGWGASCDARLYHQLLGLPVVIFGCGDLDQAHSRHERLSLGQLEAGMRVLADFLATRPNSAPA